MATVVTTPLIVITGPTASGKTALAIELAEKYGGEIVCADSRTVYKGLDIGTAKPTPSERRRVPHHLLDVALPNEPYDLKRFQADARACIADIRARGKVPFLVGGSGLYIDSIVLDYQLGSAPDQQLRATLSEKSIDDLLLYCIENNIKIPDNSHNKRYVIRAIEQGGVNESRRSVPASSSVMIAVKNDNETLKERISARARAIFGAGVTEETVKVATLYGDDIAPLRAPAYAAALRLRDGEISYEEAIAALARADWQLARKQMTWLRRHSWLTWLEYDAVDAYVKARLDADGVA